MYPIDMTPMSDEFRTLWFAAGSHLQSCMDGGANTWLRSHHTPPYLEHLSFILGNQLFFIFLIDADGVVESPGSLRGLQRVTEACQGVPCLMPMRRAIGTDVWHPATPGWGLLHAATHEPVMPPELISDEAIEMTDWELQDFAVKIVRNDLEAKGHELMSWNADPEVSPNIWFVGDSQGPEWITVRAARYPSRCAIRPDNLATLELSVHGFPCIGHFASVSFANADDPFDPMASSTGNFLPLWRGHKAAAFYDGLESAKLS